MTDRQYNLSLGELLDRLSVVQMKEVKIPEHKAEYAKEIVEIVNDINVCLSEKREYITAEWLRDIIILAQFNAHIWYNEGDIRADIHNKETLTDEELIKIAKKLILTHSINGVRTIAKNRVSKVIGGRIDLKVDSLAADCKHWKPSGY
jgi:hypothetical protein